VFLLWHDLYRRCSCAKRLPVDRIASGHLHTVKPESSALRAAGHSPWVTLGTRHRCGAWAGHKLSGARKGGDPPCHGAMAGAGKALALPPAFSSARIIAQDHTLEDLLISTSFAELQVRPAMPRSLPASTGYINMPV